MPVIPLDALAAAGKLSIMEDDSRTQFDIVIGCAGKLIVPFSQTGPMVRRNLLTSFLKGAGIYQYPMCGPWARVTSPENVTYTREIWSNVTAVNKAIGHLAAKTLAPGAGLCAEVAIFIPSTAAKTRTYGMMYDHLDTNTDDYATLHYQLGALGAPVRWLFLEQLPSLPASILDCIKLAVLTSPIVISESLATVIKTRLATGNRTLVYTGSVGLLTSVTANDFNLSRAASITGLPLRGHGSAAPIKTKLADPASHHSTAPRWSKQLLAAAALPFRTWEGAPGTEATNPDYVSRYIGYNLTSPWYDVQTGNVAVLGRYVGGGKSNALVSIAHRDNGDHRVVYSCQSWLPRLAWRKLAQAAGVHLYVDGGTKDVPIFKPGQCKNASACSKCMHAIGGTCLGFGDVVEATGPALMVHAGPTLMHGHDRVRTVQLPCAATTVRDEQSEIVCKNCSAFNTSAMVAGDVLLYDVDITCTPMGAEPSIPARTTVFQVGDLGSTFIRTPTIARLGDSSTLVAIVNCRFNVSGLSYQPCGLCSKVSTDGSSWPDTMMTNITAGHPANGQAGSKDPVTVWDEQSGELWLLYEVHTTCKHLVRGGCKHISVWIAKTKTGVSWYGHHQAWDEERMGLGPGSATQLRRGPHKGRIIVPAYGPWVDAPCNGPESTWTSECFDRAAVFYTDDGIAFQRSVVSGSLNTINNTYLGMAEPVPVELSNGTIRFDMRNEDCSLNCCNVSKCLLACHDPARVGMCVPWAHVRSYSLSTDSGHTFGPAIPDNTLYDPGGDAGCQASMLRDDDTSALFFTNPHNRTVRVDLTLQGRRRSVVISSTRTTGPTKWLLVPDNATRPEKHWRAVGRLRQLQGTRTSCLCSGAEIHLIVKHVDSVCWVYERVRVSDLHCDYLFIYQFGIHLSTMS